MFYNLYYKLYHSGVTAEKIKIKHVIFIIHFFVED